MRAYYVKGLGWMICLARTKAEARHEGVEEWGRGLTTEVRLATSDECRDYFNQRKELIIAGN